VSAAISGEQPSGNDLEKEAFAETCYWKFGSQVATECEVPVSITVMFRNGARSSAPPPLELLIFRVFIDREEKPSALIVGCRYQSNARTVTMATDMHVEQVDEDSLCVRSSQI
jgi:hypothetical protein